MVHISEEATSLDNGVQQQQHRHSSVKTTADRSMLLKIYSGLVLLLDVLALLVRLVVALLEALLQLVVPAQEKSLQGEVALVTGAGHGIGRELSQQLAALGATVVCWDVNPQTNAKTVEELKQRGHHRAHAYTCDVSSRDEVLRVAKLVRAEVGDVTLLINNAGIMPCRPFLQHQPHEIINIFNINVFAHFWILEAFLPSMLEKNHGHVVGLSSMAGVMGIPNLVPYCASKFAVRGMMESLAEEVRESNQGKSVDVHFTTIMPFIVDTGLCQKPRTRFPSLLGIVPIQKAASEIIKATRRNYHEHTIPGGLLDLNHFLRLFPVKASHIIRDFLDSGVNPHDN